MAKKQFWSQLTERATKEAILVKIIREVAKKAILVTIIREGGKKAMLVTIIREGGAILGAEQIVNHHRFPPAPGPTELRKARKKTDRFPASLVSGAPGISGLWTLAR